MSRTKSTTSAMQKRKLKMAALGVDNEIAYFFARCRREFTKLGDKLRPRSILIRIRAKKYDHVLSIGMNCEPAFRFALSWRFVDSIPFSWASSIDLNQLTEAILHPELIGSNDFLFLDEVLMWRCNRTKINFHGKLIKNPASPPDSEAIAADKADLFQRLTYLNDKFTRILSDSSTKAIVFRINTLLTTDKDINTKIDTLQRALEMRGARNYTLVIVTEDSAKGKIRPAPNRVVRTVKAFNPKNAVTNPKLGDPPGWRAIYKEFSPKKTLQKKRLFKFEQH